MPQANRSERRAAEKKNPGKNGTQPEAPQPEAPPSYTLELSLEQMGFLRLILTNATVQPAELKKICGEVQFMVESHIGPLPPGAA